MEIGRTQTGRAPQAEARDKAELAKAKAEAELAESKAEAEQLRCELRAPTYPSLYGQFAQ